MGKTKTPFFSMGSSGTIGRAITSQKRGAQTLFRAKPTPADPYSLAQAYQRWLYQDYCAEWLALSASDKQTWRSAGSRHHLTGMSYFLRNRLTSLPDIAGGWHLDFITGNSVIDFSKNLNHGTVYGATLVDGRIDHALSFDGLDDTVNMGNKPSLNVLSYTQDLFLYPLIDLDATITTSPHLWTKYNTYYLWYNAGWLYAALFDGADAWQFVEVLINLPKDNWHHIAATYDLTSRDFILYVHGHQLALKANIIGHTTAATDLFLCSAAGLTGWLNAIVDHPVLYNRALTPSDILRHSLRRYPV